MSTFLTLPPIDKTIDIIDGKVKRKVQNKRVNRKTKKKKKTTPYVGNFKELISFRRPLVYE